MYAPVVSRFLTYEIPLSDEVQQYATRIMALPAIQEWFQESKKEIDAGLPDQWVVEMVRNVR
ncbi:MAG: glutathione S-transferase, partial [Pseudomonadota bacterium]